jgi:hypothetical protein
MIPGCLLLAYFGVFALLVGGQLLFLQGRSPREKKYWHPRLSLLNLVVIGGFLVVMVAASSRQSLPVIVTVLILAVMGFIAHTRILVCDQCGATAQPQSLVTAARFCPKCGAPLTRARLSDPKP